MAEQSKLRVGHALALDNGDATLVRKELECSRWLAQLEDGHYVVLFACERTLDVWVTEDRMTRALNGEPEA